MNFDKIKQEISIVSYLKSIGCAPRFENDFTARFLAPYRADSKPSLCVNKLSNLWYDHGLGKGGNIIQLAALINSCTDYEASKMLLDEENSFSFHCKPITEQESSIEIVRLIPLINISLLDYLKRRKININIAKEHCKEVHYTVSGKHYFAIGFQNDVQGYELRNKYFKGCTNKHITSMIKGSEELYLFEGFIDYMSFLSYYNLDVKSVSDSIVLNSITNINKAKEYFLRYSKINLYLDNDQTSKKIVQSLEKEFSQVVDCSCLYSGYKDFNDFVMAI